jgi:hypothetical protein
LSRYDGVRYGHSSSGGVPPGGGSAEDAELRVAADAAVAGGLVGDLAAQRTFAEFVSASRREGFGEEVRRRLYVLARHTGRDTSRLTHSNEGKEAKWQRTGGRRNREARKI